MMNTSVPSAAFPALAAVPTTVNNLLDRWQAWSDATFDDKYREAILTLVEGVLRLVVYLMGLAYYWLKLQTIRTVRYWLSEAVQAVPVLNGWWRAPFVAIVPTQYAESCWQAINAAVASAILDYELDWAWDAEPLT